MSIMLLYSTTILWVTLEIQPKIQLQDRVNFLVGKKFKVTEVSICKLHVAKLDFVKPFNQTIPNTTGITLHRECQHGTDDIKGHEI